MTEAIVVTDTSNEKSFWKTIPVHLQEWVRKGSKCYLKTKAVLDYFPSYLKNFVKQKSTQMQDELHETKYMTENGPKFSLHLLQFAMLLRYTSLPANKVWKEHFPLPLLSLLSKFSKGGITLLIATKLLPDKQNISKDVNLLLNEIYIQKFYYIKMVECTVAIVKEICIKAS